MGVTRFGVRKIIRVLYTVWYGLMRYINNLVTQMWTNHKTSEKGKKTHQAAAGEQILHAHIQGSRRRASGYFVGCMGYR